MADKDKIKLIIALACLLLAVVLLYWFSFRKPGETAPTGAPAPVTDSGQPGGPPPAANRRVSPELLKQQPK